MVRFWALLLLWVAGQGCASEEDPRGGRPYEDGDLVRQVFHQSVPEALDVLLVVDDSCSMGPYQQVLGDSFAPFVGWFEQTGVAYRIAVTTTSYADDQSVRRIHGTIRPDTPNAAGVFAEYVDVGIRGSVFERGLDATLFAWDYLASYGEFARPGAELAVVYVSDEEDGSHRPVSDYLNGLGDRVGYRGAFNTSAFVAVDMTQCPSDSQSTPGTRYVDAVEHTGGVVVDLCEAYDADDDTVFKSLVPEVSRVSARLERSIRLYADPDLTTLSVTNDGAPLICGVDWTVRPWQGGEEAGFEVYFFDHAIPMDGERVELLYVTGPTELDGLCLGG